MATHSSILAWRIPMDRRGYSPRGCKELDTTERLSTTDPKNTTTARHVSVC